MLQVNNFLLALQFYNFLSAIPFTIRATPASSGLEVNDETDNTIFIILESDNTVYPLFLFQF